MMSDFRIGIHTKISRDEKLAELAVIKAKELLISLNENNSVAEIKDDSEEVKVKRPSKNPSEEKTSMPKDANEAFAGDENEG